MFLIKIYGKAGLSCELLHLHMVRTV